MGDRADGAGSSVTEPSINTALAQIAAGSQGILKFYVVRHGDYGLYAAKAAEGEQEAFCVAAMMTNIGRNMTAGGEVAPCLLCDRMGGFVGSGGVALVGPNPLQPGCQCVFRLLCGPCCEVTDAELMRAVTERWRVVVTPTLRVLPPAHEAGRA